MALLVGNGDGDCEESSGHEHVLVAVNRQPCYFFRPRAEVAEPAQRGAVGDSWPTMASCVPESVVDTPRRVARPLLDCDQPPM